METADLIKFWIESSDKDFVTMKHLFQKKDYHWSLFMGHLVVETLLKTYYVKKVDNNPPYIHNLLRLAEKSGLELTENQKDFLVTVTTFNISARYDDYKMDFYKTCTKKFTKKWIEEIKGFRKWIKTQHLN